MKRIALILVMMFVAIIALLETSGKHRRRINYVPDRKGQDDVWLGN